MQEQVCNFGPAKPGRDKNLIGILTKPAPDRALENAPAVIILNAGIVHRVGPFRLHVDLARRFAAGGFATLRMDLSGLGDSRLQSEQLAPDRRSIQDVSDAMDFLEQEAGKKQFVVLGLCSGAYNAHQIATRDHRIVGAAFLDGIVFRTPGFYVRHYGLRFLKPRFWRNAIKRRLTRDLKSIDESDGQILGESQFFDTTHLDQEAVADELRQMLDRDIQMLFLYTEGYDDICSRSQFVEMYGIQPNEQLQVDYFSKAEHTFRLIENRTALVERISNWLTARFTTPSQMATSS